jgi:putative inorganic carbon (HCO3(-)) transporter
MFILQKHILHELSKYTLVSIVLVIACLGIAIPFLSLQQALAITGGILGLILLFICIVNYVLGYILSITAGFSIFILSRLFLDAFPIGWIVELLVYATFLGVLMNSFLQNISLIGPLKHPITLFFLFNLIYLFWQLFNPNYDSYFGWFNFFRRQIMIFTIYVVTVYVAQKESDIRWMFKVWFVVFFIAALYAVFTQWFGMPAFEDEWVRSSKTRKSLYNLVDGFKRKYSLYSDPAAFGMDMAAATIIGIVYFLATKSFSRRILLIIFCLICFLASVYSGTRTSYLMIIAALLLYLLMRGINRTTFIVGCSLLISILGILFLPIYNNVFINRLRSAFHFNKDASLQVRNINRERIQPYLYEHPIGGGVYTTGGQGDEFNPGHYLAGFPPDSGYLRTALETGIIGLFILLLFHFIILKSGIFAFFRQNSIEFKNASLISTLIIFSFIIANYSQDAFGQIPSCFLFCLCLATIVRSKQSLNM